MGVAEIECQKLDIFYIIIQHACYIIFQKLIKSKNPGYGCSHQMISHEGWLQKLKVTPESIKDLGYFGKGITLPPTFIEENFNIFWTAAQVNAW